MRAHAPARAGADMPCLDVVGTRSVRCHVPGRESRTYSYDQVLYQCSQEEVFMASGLPVVDNCMAGYNSSIFAYGQTGAGKTYTMLGSIVGAGEAASEKVRRGFVGGVMSGGQAVWVVME